MKNCLSTSMMLASRLGHDAPNSGVVDQTGCCYKKVINGEGPLIVVAACKSLNNDIIGC